MIVFDFSSGKKLKENSEDGDSKIFESLNKDAPSEYQSWKGEFESATVNKEITCKIRLAMGPKQYSLKSEVLNQLYDEQQLTSMFEDPNVSFDSLAEDDLIMLTKRPKSKAAVSCSLSSKPEDACSDPLNSNDRYVFSNMPFQIADYSFMSKQFMTKR